MDDVLTRLFNDFDRGKITRRHLLQALGLAAVAAPLRAFGQGSCGGTRAGTPQCDTVSFKPPFDPTGWKTVLLDHFTMTAPDYKAEAAYYATLMNWKIRSDDGNQAMLDIGDWGGVLIREGPPPPPRAPAADTAGRAAGAGAAGGGGGGGGRGGGRGGGSRAVWDGFCWGIEPWDARRVEAELRRRGLNPVAENDGKDFQSFRFKDPDGFNVQVSNGNKRNRRTTPASAKLSAPAPFAATSWKTVWLDHISFGVTSYKESVAFYQALLGWKPEGDEGSQNTVQIGEIGGAIIRGGNANAPGGLTAGRGGRGSGRGDTTAAAGPPPAPAPLVRRASIGHISFGITPWDPDAVKAELDKRGLSARVDTGGSGDIHTAAYQSYHTQTPGGFDLQISNTIRF